MSAQQETSRAMTHRVLILGGGYAGMAAAVQLAARAKRRSGVQVTVVNAHERFTERMRLHMAATGRRLAELGIPEMPDGTGARFVRGWVTRIDADAKAVRIDGDEFLPYDTLVYGLGSVTDASAVTPGRRGRHQVRHREGAAAARESGRGLRVRAAAGQGAGVRTSSMTVPVRSASGWRSTAEGASWTIWGVAR